MGLEDNKGALVYKTVQLEYEWGENPVIDEYSRQYGYSSSEPIVYIGVVDALSKVVSFVAAMPNEIRLFRNSEQVIGDNGIDELKRILEMDYLAVANMGKDWSISSEKPIPATEELAETLLMEDDSYPLE